MGIALAVPISNARRTAIPLSLQMAIFVLVAAYLVQRRAALRKRNLQRWAALVGRLLPRLSSARGDLAEAIDRRFTNGMIERRAASAAGRREMFREAGAMMEMADYAERNGEATNAPAVASVRSHAVAIRLRTVMSFLGFVRRPRT